MKEALPRGSATWVCMLVVHALPEEKVVPQDEALPKEDTDCEL